MKKALNREHNMAIKIHKFGHGRVREMAALMKSTEYDEGRINRAREKVYEAWETCAATGRPVDGKKISATHINSAFNEEIQAYFMYVRIRGDIGEILNIIDLGTKYGEMTLKK